MDTHPIVYSDGAATGALQSNSMNDNTNECSMRLSYARTLERKKSFSKKIQLTLLLFLRKIKFSFS